MNLLLKLVNQGPLKGDGLRVFEAGAQALQGFVETLLAPDLLSVLKGTLCIPQEIVPVRKDAGAERHHAAPQECQQKPGTESGRAPAAPFAETLHPTAIADPDKKLIG